MTADEKYEIAVLAEAAHTASQRFSTLAVCNYPNDLDEQRKARVEYAIAATEALETEMALVRAQQRIANKS